MNKKAEERKISDLLVALLLGGLFVTVIGMWLGDGAVRYNLPYNSSEFSAFNKVTDIVSISEEVKAATESTKEQSNTLSGVVDRVGSFFAAGYRVLLLLFNSMGLVGSIIFEGIIRLGLGVTAAIFQTVSTTAVVVIFVVGIIVAILVKWRT